MRVEFELGREDIRAYSAFLTSHDRDYVAQVGKARRRVLVEAGLLGLVGVALMYDVVRVHGSGGVTPWIALGVAVLSLGGALGMIGDAQVKRSRMMSDWLEQNTGRVRGMRLTASLTTEGIEYSWTQAAAIYRWNELVREIVETETHIFVAILPTGALVIPKRAFGGSSEAAEFAARARALCAGAGGPAPVRAILAHLERTDFACPACRYNLRGVGEARCPECGREIREEDVAKALGSAGRAT